MYITDVFFPNNISLVVSLLRDNGIFEQMSTEHIGRTQKINPDCNANNRYIGRSNRKEWAPVGMISKIVMLQDGSLQVNDFVKPGVDGIATKSDTPTQCRVMKVIDQKHIKILILR